MSEQATPKPQQVADDEIDLRELFSAIWQGKWFIIAIIFVFAVCSVFYVLSLPNIYKAEAILVPASQEQNMRVGGQLGSLAALAGVNLGSSSANKTVLALEILKSRDFLGRFIEKYDLYVPVMAAIGWDLKSNTLLIDDSIYDGATGEWLRAAKQPRKAKPSILETYMAFVSMLRVSQDSETGIIRISIEHLSPYLAKEWVDLLIKELNEEMRQRDLSDALRSIAYLNDQSLKTNLADARAMLFSLIEEQTKTLMLTNVREEYVLKTIDPAVVAELKSKPARALICIFSVLLGGILSVLIVLVRHFNKK